MKRVVPSHQLDLVAHEKMSKSKFNGISPEAVTKKWGADVLRLYMLSKCPPEQNLAWQDSAIVGSARLLQRIKTVLGNGSCGENENLDASAKDRTALVKWMRGFREKMLEAYEKSFAFNAAVTALTKFLTAMERYPSQSRR